MSSAITLSYDRQQRRKQPPSSCLLATHGQSWTTQPQDVNGEPVSKSIDEVAFNPKSILPNTKSAKCVSYLKNSSSIAVTSMERIDLCEIDWNQSRTLQTRGSSTFTGEKEPFLAFGIEAYPTLAIFNDICHDFVRPSRWCKNGKKCLRVHPIKRQDYLDTVIRESVIYSQMRAKRIADHGLALSGPTITRTLNLTSTPISPDFKLVSSPDMKETSARHVDTRRDRKQTGSSASWSSQTTEVNYLSDHRIQKPQEDCQGPNGDNDNPWSAEQPKWHTTEDDRHSDKGSGYCSSSNSSPSHQISDPFHLSTVSRRSEAEGSRPRSLSSDVCRNWLRGVCNRGFTCKYVHEDLEHDTDSILNQQDRFNNKTAVVVLRRGPEIMMRKLHRHMRVNFAPGFDVAELSTGFESFCVSIGGLGDISDSEILELVKPFGKVIELRRPVRCTQTTVRVYFEKTTQAFAALVALHGKRLLDRTLQVKPTNETNGNRFVYKGNAVLFEWDAPCRTVYMGYSSRQLAEQAVDDARLKRCGGFMSAANIHFGIPAVGSVTVRFRYVPVDVNNDMMKIFGPHAGMVTSKPNVKCTMQDLERGFKRFLKTRRFKITEVDIRGPPYMNGRMTAWVTFANAEDAKEAAKCLHSSDDFMGGMSISAFHVKAISFSLAPQKYQTVKSEILAFQTRLLKDGNGYWIRIVERREFITVHISGAEVKILGRLKAEFERILNGEQLLHNGKVVWHPFLAGPEGREFLDKLQLDFPGVVIVVSNERNSVRLLGDVEKRSIVRTTIINFVDCQRARSQYIVPLDARLANMFSKNGQDGFDALELQLGLGNVLLDLWQCRLVISGDLDAYTLAKDTIFAFRQKHRLIGPQWRGEVCPACTGVASSPMKLPCGHSWCRSCLKHYLKSSMELESRFPLTCHGIDKKCGEPIPLITARDVLLPDDFEALFHSAFSAYVSLHPEELRYCPTPDCPQVYRSTPEGILMQCPECLYQICTHCHCEAHEGLTCAELKDGDGLFWEWAAANNIKGCPKCKMAIEKTEGCNHITCRICQTHICWVCMETFDNGLKIYGHMQSEHGGSGV